MQSARVLEVAVADAGRRLDAFLAERLGVSRAEARRLLARGGIRVDGRPLGAGAKGVALRAGERVEVADATPPEERHVVPEPDAPLALLAEGEGWLVADKPAGVPVHPLEPGKRGTLLGAVAARRPEIDGVGEGALRSGVVHRLDVDTSGAIVLATAEPVWQRLRAAFRARQVTKVYRAIALGRVEPDAQHVELPLVTARHRPAFVRVANEREQADARLCRTSWQVLERLRGATLLEVRTESGFLHQVRATLAHLGHPLAGDRNYASAGDRNYAPDGDRNHAPDGDRTYAREGDASGASRQMLHAARIAFEEIDATSPDPDDFRRVLESLRG